MSTLETVLRGLALGLAVAAGVVLIAYAMRFVRAAVTQLFVTLRDGSNMAAAPLQRAAKGTVGAMGHLQRHLTREGKLSLIGQIVAVALLLPLELLVLVIDIRASTAYFETMYPEDVEIPLLGIVSGGFLRALIFVATGMLVGYLVEGALELVPLPLIHAVDGDRARRWVKAGVLAVAGCLWLVVFSTQWDVATEAYATQGQTVCLLRYADSTPAVLSPRVDDLRSDSLSPPTDDTAQLAAQRDQCLQDWKEDERAKGTFVALAELALHLSFLFAWVFFTLVGLLGFVLLALVLVPIGLPLGLLRVVSFLATPIWFILDRLLEGILWLCSLVVRALRKMGLPLPPPEEGNQPPAGGAGGAGGGPAAGHPQQPQQPGQEQAAPPPNPQPPNGHVPNRHVPNGQAPNGQARAPGVAAPAPPAAGGAPNGGTPPQTPAGTAAPGAPGEVRRPTAPAVPEWDL